MNSHHAILLLSATLLLTACSGSGGDDLDTYIAETKAKPAGEIEPVPTFRPYTAYKYSAVALRSPFEAPQLAVTPDGDYGRVTVAPDESRPKELLESFNFASLTMVGTLERDGATWGLIDDGQGGIHRVRVGNYLGKNHGRIVSLSRSQVDVLEIVPDGKNGWVERPRTLALKES
jgi:type IV pilus assembly protein PilP